MMRNNYFEGWYFKHQCGSHTVCLIPAFHRGKDGETASIQIIWEKGSEMIMFSYAPAGNIYGPGIKIENNIFSDHGVSVDIKSDKITVSGRLKYGKLTPPVSDVMGPFRFVPLMQCRHGVISLVHGISGELVLNGEKYDFNGGTGYIEKDWGTSFPRSYVWTQCNAFKDRSCCVMISAAQIPFGAFSFRGCICCVLYNGHEYRLATYNGAKILRMNSRCVIIKQGHLAIRADLIKESPFPLAAPLNGGMTRTIRESVCCHVRYRFFAGPQKVFDYESEAAGFEYSDTAHI